MMKKKMMQFTMAAIAAAMLLGAAAMPAKADSGVKINSANFADKQLQKIAKQYDKNKDGYLSASEAKKVTKITCYAATSYKGIEYFTELKEFSNAMSQYHKTGSDKTKKKKLDLSKNKKLKEVVLETDTLSSVDVSGCKQLKRLYCDKGTGTKAKRGTLTAINVKGCTSLKELQCFNSKLKSIDVSSCTNLETLALSNNKLIGVKLGNIKKLQTLSVNGNRTLKKLNVDKQSNLKALNFSFTNISKINLKRNRQLEELVCGSSALKKLDLKYKSKLKYLDCSDASEIAALSVQSSPRLRELNCSGTKISKLELGKNKGLTTLDCHGANLTGLNLRNNAQLKELDCSNNQISDLDVSNLTALRTLDCSNNNISKLDLSRNINLSILRCTNNKITELNLHNTLLGAGKEGISYTVLECDPSVVVTR